MTKIQLKVIELARKYVHKCDVFNKSLHVTLLMHGNFPVEYGVNCESAHLANAHGYIHCSQHSEYNCIQRFRRKNMLGQLYELDLYNIRISRRHELKMSRPCARCQTLLNKYQPRRIFYTDDYGHFIRF